MDYLRRKLSSHNLIERVVFSIGLFIILFHVVAVLSYFLLPEGVLKSKNPLHNWETSSNTFALTCQIFFYNMLSVLVIVAASLFGKKKETESNYLSVGYSAFFTLICINGVVLGTWSFSSAGEAVPFLDRITRTFDLVHRAGFWEMMGQLLITCSVAHIAIILTNGKNTVIQKIRDIRLTTSEKAVFGAGLAFMLVGAIIESIAINGL